MKATSSRQRSLHRRFGVPRLSTRRAVTLLVLLALAGCAAEPAAKKQRHLERGLAFQTAAKHNEAIIELKSALQIDPAFVPALHALGRSYRLKSWHADAIRELGRALELKPDALETKSELGRAYLALEVWAQAREQGEAIRARAPDSPEGLYLVGAALGGERRPADALAILVRAQQVAPDSADIHQAVGDIHVRAGRAAEGATVYRTALAKDPGHVEAMVGLGTLLLRQGDLTGAGELLRRAKTAAPESSRVSVALSQLLSAEQKHGDAVKELESIPRQAWSPMFELTLANIYLREGRYDGAVTVLEPLVKRYPDFVPARHLLGVAALAARRPDVAVTAFQEILKREPGSLVARYGLGNALVQSGRAAESLVELQKIAAPLRQTPDYHMLVGQALLDLNRLPEAATAAESARAIAPQRPEPYDLLARVHAARKDIARAEAQYGKALELDPGFLRAHTGLGLLYESQQRPDEAIRAYDAALKKHPRDRRALAGKVAALVQARRLDDAIRSVQEALGPEPRDPYLLTALGRLYLARNDVARGRAELAQAVKVDAKFVPALLTLAGLAVREKKDAEAIAGLRAVLAQQPGHAGAATLLAGLFTRQARHDQAIAILEAAAPLNPGNAELTFQLGEAYVRSGRPDDAIGRLSPVVARNPSVVRGHLVLGIAHLRKGNPAEAIKQFEQVNRINPNVAQSHYYLGRALVARGDAAAARRAYDRALQIDPGYRDARIALAAVTGQAMDPATVAIQIDELNKALREDPDDLALRYTLARTYIAARRPKDAEREFARILSINGGFAPAHLAMAMFRAQERKPEEAAEHLKTALRNEPDNIEANAFLAAYYEQRRRWALAIPLLERVASQMPERYDIKLRLAASYGHVGRLEDGVATAREVTAARPKLGAPHYVLGDLLLREGKIGPAIESLTTAVRLVPGHGPAYFVLGVAHERRGGDPEPAVAAYRRAQALMPNDPMPYNNAAWVYASHGRQLDHALAFARRAYELASQGSGPKPALPGVLDTLGFVHLQRREYDLAEPLLRRAVELAVNEATIQYHLGLTYFRMGRRDDAATWLRRSLQDPKLAEAPAARRLLKELGG